MKSNRGRVGAGGRADLIKNVSLTPCLTFILFLLRTAGLRTSNSILWAVDIETMASFQQLPVSSQVEPN